MTLESQLPSAPLEATASPRKVNWKQVGIFIALTFALTWTLDLVLYLQGGLTAPAIGMALQLQMLLPAFSAILLGMFFFKDSPISLRTNKRTSRWFTWYFLLFTLIYITAFAWSSFRPWDYVKINTYMLIPSILGMLLALVLRIVGKKDSFAGAGLGGGKAKWWLWLGLGVLGYMLLQSGLNWLFKLGSPADISGLLGSLGATGMPQPLLFVVLTVQTVLLGPFLGLLITLGEEYGWRGYLQPALTPLGRVRGVLLVGIIWGVWHAPIILMGYNYPGHPVLGALLFVPVCIGLAFFLGYATLKAKGVWIAAFLHALFNQSASYFLGFVYTPRDPFFAFGAGLLSLITLGLVVLLLLRDPVWKQKD
jgi:membrane protease YdiL (CAAX protease family)